MDEKILKLHEILKNSRNICVFTGAGISCPSGIPDFRFGGRALQPKKRIEYPARGNHQPRFFYGAYGFVL